MMANTIALLTLAFMVAAEARRASGGWRLGLYSLATIVALTAVALGPITSWLPTVGIFLTGVFGSPLAWFVLLMGLFLALRPYWAKAPRTTAEGAAAQARILATKAGLLARRIEEYRATRYLWRDRLPSLVPIVLDGTSLLISFEKAGFAVPLLETGEAERVAVGLEHYFSRIYPLIRDGHEQDARNCSTNFAESARRAALTFQPSNWWTAGDF